jgi:hypothetical protein
MRQRRAGIAAESSNTATTSEERPFLMQNILHPRTRPDKRAG